MPPSRTPPVGGLPPLRTRLALFDTDCLEAAGPDSLRSTELPAFGIRERVQPLAAKIDALHAFAKRHDLTVVFTQCCSARAVAPGSHPDVLIVPMDPDDQRWIESADRFRLINIQKHHAAPLHESFICRHFDMFQHNANARRLLEILGIPRWIVFGHGFDLCVDSAVKGILASGCRAHILTDVIAPSATGYGPYGTPESMRLILDYLVKIGVTAGPLDTFLEEHDH